MRAILLQGHPDLTTILRTLFGLTAIRLAVVASEEELLRAAAHARDGDFLILDCSSALAEDVERCTRIVTATTLPVHIVHPREDTVQMLQIVAPGVLTWVIPDFPVLSQLEKLRLLQATAPAHLPREGVALTAREREVHRLIAQGRADKEIARQLQIEPGTVKTYVARLKQKLGLARRQELISVYHRTTPP